MSGPGRAGSAAHKVGGGIVACVVGAADQVGGGEASREAEGCWKVRKTATLSGKGRQCAWDAAEATVKFRVLHQGAPNISGGGAKSWTWGSLSKIH